MQMAVQIWVEMVVPMAVLMAARMAVQIDRAHAKGWWCVCGWVGGGAVNTT